ncbi:MAG TPA: hypothetical protein VLK33_22935 [Terriglobales bacterium]|nr:hypothetical protein [Terriglobales bacterium]
MSSTRQQAAELYHQLYLEVQHLKAGIAYEQATSFCDDCPLRNWDDWTPECYHDMEFGPSIADHCCKDDPDHLEGEFKHIATCEAIMAQLKEFAGDEELAAARAKVAQK